MRIWVDADACPKPVKEIPFRAASRVGSALTVRRFMDELRGSGVETGGPPPFNHGDRQAFANQLDSFLARCGPAKIDTKSPA